jgi:hypothetical protein
MSEIVRRLDTAEEMNSDDERYVPELNAEFEEVNLSRVDERVSIILPVSLCVSDKETPPFFPVLDNASPSPSKTSPAGNSRPIPLERLSVVPEKDFSVAIRHYLPNFAKPFSSFSFDLRHGLGERTAQHSFSHCRWIPPLDR